MLPVVGMKAQDLERKLRQHLLDHAEQALGHRGKAQR